jgi:hypothetical protein
LHSEVPVVPSKVERSPVRNNKGINWSAAKTVLEGKVMKELRPKNRMQDEETFYLK